VQSVLLSGIQALSTGLCPLPPTPVSRSVTAVAFSMALSAKPQRSVGPVNGDTQGDHTAVLGHPNAVHYERHQLQTSQVGGEQLCQGMLGRRDEPA
jgi:hypothetical protein